MGLRRLALAAFVYVAGVVSVANAQIIRAPSSTGHSAPVTGSTVPFQRAPTITPSQSVPAVSAPASATAVPARSVVVPPTPPVARAEMPECKVAEIECAWQCYREYRLTQLSHRQWCVTQKCEVKDKSCGEKLVEMLDR